MATAQLPQVAPLDRPRLRVALSVLTQHQAGQRVDKLAGMRAVRYVSSALEDMDPRVRQHTGDRPNDTGEVAGAGIAERQECGMPEPRELIKVKRDYYVHKEVIDDLRAKLLGHLEQHGQITPLEWKDMVGATRKYTIPLAEYFDAIKVTLRIGDVRKRRG